MFKNPLPAELIDTLWNVNYSLKEILHNPV